MADISVIKVNNADYTIKDQTARNHITNKSNPHEVTKAQVGLGNVENKSASTIIGEITSSDITGKLGYTPVNPNVIGANSGIAPLDATGKIDAQYLPSYVDDVIEGYLYNGAFYKEASHTTLITGEAGKIYIDLADNNKTYRWSGSVYAEISASTVYTGTAGITVNGTTISHTNSVTAGKAEPDTQEDGTINLPEINYDAQGHITSVVNRNIAVGISVGAISSGLTTEAEYTPAGSVTAPTFNGASMTATGSFTPSGSVSKPNVTVTPSSASTLTSVATAGTTPTWSASVANETLSFSFTAGAMPTFNSANRLTSVSAELASTPEFTGTAGSVSVTGTTTGSCSAPTFNGTKTYIATGFDELVSIGG